MIYERLFHLLCFISQYLDKFEGSLVPISRPVWKRVERIANHIIESNPIVKSMDVKKWKLTLIDDKTINAFIVPVSYLYHLYTGTLKNKIYKC